MKIGHRLTTLMTGCFLLVTSFAQKKSATVSGRVLDENENAMGRVSVVILGRQSGLVTSDSGTFRLTVPADKAFALQFSYSGYRVEQRNFMLSPGEHETV